ncbi:hypothetical protein N7493_005953 [Penicillium malachiteum]|uniref:Uncharacterized protein n=1 Tax=Penicillium malachiteum TaxID=1324776 RepID=A0AAD6MVW4_9EURO|nr:hypothetical protein N7493_005953 [Penicillium malachiteum]
MQLKVQNTIPMNPFLFYARKMAWEILNPRPPPKSESEWDSDSNRETESEWDSENNRNMPGIQAENLFCFKNVTRRGKTYHIAGRSDYSLWFGDEESLQCSLVVVESKTPKHRPDRNDARYLLLCYMAMVHRARCDAGNTDGRVWGVATIGTRFYFVHITDSGEWALNLVDMSPRMDSEGLNKILAILTAMIVDGAKQTPVPLFNLNAPRPDVRWTFRSRMIVNYD